MTIRIILMISMMQMMLWGGAGDLDSTFGGDGKVTTAVGSSSDYAESVAIQSDGKIVVAGYSHNGSNWDFSLVRYNNKGSLDTAFGTQGKVITNLDSSNDEAHGVVIQNDGKIVVAGSSGSGSNHDFALVRYNSNGTLDKTFSGDGIVTTDVGGFGDYAESIAIQSDGKIVVAGSSWNGSNWYFALARFTSHGDLDTTFGDDGKILTNPGGILGLYDNKAYSVAIQSDGKIIVAGNMTAGSNSDFALVRHNSNGDLDKTFGDNGVVITSIGFNDYARSVAIQSDGKIIAAGYTDINGDDYFALVRLQQQRHSRYKFRQGRYKPRWSLQ